MKAFLFISIYDFLLLCLRFDYTFDLINTLIIYLYKKKFTFFKYLYNGIFLSASSLYSFS